MILFAICFTVGIGGGGFITIFDKKLGKVEMIDFGGTTPSGINDDDFDKSLPNKRYYVDEKLMFGRDIIFAYVRFSYVA